MGRSDEGMHVECSRACGSQALQSRPTAGCRPSAGKVQLQSHLQPTANLESWKGPGKEATARLIPSRPFAEAAEEVGHTGRSAQGCVLGFAGWGKSTSVVRASRHACLAGDNFRMGAQQNALLRRPFPFAEMWLAEATSQASLLISSRLSSTWPPSLGGLTV